MKAFIHIGTEKTGTTTIQDSLFLNRESLSVEGFYFGDRFGGRNNIDLAIYSKNEKGIERLDELYEFRSKNDRDSWKSSFRKTFQESIKELSDGHKTFIFSSEHLSSCLRERGEIENVKILMEDVFDEVKIIVYLRRQDLLLASRFNELLKSGWYRKSILPPSLVVNKHIYDYSRLVSLWGNVFGSENIIVRNFDKNKFVNSNLVEDFAAQIGLILNDEKYIELSKQSNRSLSGDAQRALMYFNYVSSVLGLKRNSKFSIVGRKTLIEIFEKTKFSDTKTLSREEAIVFYELFSESNKNLPTEASASKEFFELDFSMYNRA